MSLTTCSPRRPRAVGRRLVIGACVAGAALIGLPSMASAASSCAFNANALFPTVEVVDGSGGGAPVRIVRSGQSIAIVDGVVGSGTPRVCGNANIFNTMRVHVTSNENPISGGDGIVIDTSQGALAPGFGDESDGIRELEVLINKPGSTNLHLHGTPGPDIFRIGAGNKIMIGPDADNDISLFDGSALFTNVFGGGGDDYISGRGGYPLSSPAAFPNFLRLFGGAGNDTLVDGLSFDELDGGSENDTLYSVDGNPTGDRVFGGAGFDTATIDKGDGTSGLEQVSSASVGRLRLSPAVVKVKAGKVARLEMSWTHPKAWKELRNVDVRIYRGADRVGTIALTPKPERIRSQGEVDLVRNASGVTHRGKAVIARLAVRLPNTMTDEQLRVDVEATDRDGRHQLEPSAGLIKIN